MAKTRPKMDPARRAKQFMPFTLENLDETVERQFREFEPPIPYPGPEDPIRDEFLESEASGRLAR